MSKLLNRNTHEEPGHRRLAETRREVELGWRGVSDIFIAQGQSELAAQIHRFVREMPPPRTERKLLSREAQKRVLRVPMGNESPNR
jgi:hypothetical protein